MKVSLKWLRDYVDFSASAEELSRRLTIAGIEVDALHHVGAAWENVWVARIEKIERHPNADRLTLVTADYGQGRRTRVVTGATNIEEGDIVPLGLVGTRYRDGHSSPAVERVLQPTNMRGVQSEGMVMSGFELGISDDHTGIMVLPSDSPVGVPLAEALGDTVIELDLKGRSDCLAMIGVAREVAALTGGSDVRVPRAVLKPSRARRDDEPVTIEIEEPRLCRRFVGILLKNVSIGPSPAWMQERLQAAGMRPINNVVDITNFVMLEWGQPLHAYDYDAVRGGRLVARPARPGERLLTLAEERPEIELTPEHLIIADAERPVGLAGVIGGADSEVTERTTSILLEAANFDPISIRRTARAVLPRPTEASRRFERGIPPESAMLGALRAAQLMVELAGAELVGEAVDTFPAPLQRTPIELPLTELRRLLGVEYTSETVAGVFDRLGFDHERRNGAFVVSPPPWRLDVERPADLVEEVARIDGYDKIPTTIMRGEPPLPTPNRPLIWEELVRDALAAAGFTEVIAYPWTNERHLALVPRADVSAADQQLARLVDSRIAPLVSPVRITNPGNRDQDVMRTAALPALLQTLADNLRHASRDAHFFEVGRIYLTRAGDLPEERRVLTAVTGEWRTGSSLAPVANDFYYVKSAVEAVLARLGISGHGYAALRHPALHPYRAAALVLNHRPESAGKKPVLPDEVVGLVAEVGADTAARFDVSQRCYAIALDLDRLIQHATSERRFQPLPRTPAVHEDLSFFVAAGPRWSRASTWPMSTSDRVFPTAR
ncbi:MAG TPA: phenylalanine--tRNA ligase subunit beta [Chloroflexota bacterium]|nr:phenylalanine--tRNA ligase subunit beta [Chloroflexota bacterium]